MTVATCKVATQLRSGTHMADLAGLLLHPWSVVVYSWQVVLTHLEGFTMPVNGGVCAIIILELQLYHQDVDWKWSAVLHMWSYVYSY